MKRILLLLFIIFFSADYSLFAQKSVSGPGSFSSSFFGPTYTTTGKNRKNRHYYIYPKAVLGNLEYGDTIIKFGFLNRSTRLVRPNANANMKIFVGQTNDFDFGPNSIHWDSTIKNYALNKKYDDNPVSRFRSTPGMCYFVMNNNGYEYDSLKGENLVILVEYNQIDTINALSWAYDFSGSQPNFYINQTKFWYGFNNVPFGDTTTVNSDRHPQLTLIFPKYKNDLEVEAFYGMGKLPKAFVKNDSIMLLVTNVGKDTTNNIKARISIIGANSYSDTFTLPNLAPEEKKWIVLASSAPKNIGFDTVKISLLNDDNPLNDSSDFIRQTNTNIFSYRDVTIPPAGGVGFNGQTGDFVAYFNTDSAAVINQLTVNLTRVIDSLKMGIWEINKGTGRPGKNIWTSKKITPSTNIFSTIINPPLKVKGGFFVGVKQIGRTNLGFAYQSENPVRPGKFFYTVPTGGTNWTDFSPNANFRPLIEPRLQMENDVSVTALSFPKDTIDIDSKILYSPKITITNIGANHQLSKFKTIVEIEKYKQIYYRDTIIDSLSSGLSRIYTLKKVKITEKGPYTIRAYTMLPNDQVIDNDTIQINLEASAYFDVQPRDFLGINNGSLIEKWFDTITPIVFIQNNGINKTGPFHVHIKISKYGKTILHDSASLSLDPQSSILQSLDSITFQDTGKHLCTVYTSYKADRHPEFDTIRVNFRVVASHDVLPLEFILPEDKKNYKLSEYKLIIPEIKIENRGFGPEKDSFNIYYKIFNNDFTKLLYIDTTENNVLYQFSNKIAFKKIFTKNKRGVFRTQIITDLPFDQIPYNDTLNGYFQVGTKIDPAMVAITFPTDTDTAELNRTDWTPKVKVTNYGFANTTGVYDVVFKAYQKGTLIYSDTKSLSLDSSEEKEITFKSGLIIPDSGKFNMFAFISPYQIGNTHNDTLTQTNLCRISYDLEAVSIYTKNKLNLNEEQTVTVSIKNKAQKSYNDINNKFEINLKYIKPNGKGSVTLTQNDTLSKGISRDYNFKFKPEYGGEYKLIAFVKSVEDQWIANDSTKSKFSVSILKDVGILSIIIPNKTKLYTHKELPFKPKVKIAHLGETASALLYKIETRISDSTSNIVYTAFTSGGLNNKETKDVTINKNFNINYGGKFEIISIVETTGDFNQKNDTLKANFRIAYKVDLNLVKKYNLTIMPNPFHQKIQIKGLPSNGIISIFNTEGKLISKTNNSEINTKNYKNGIYTLKITMPEGSQSIKIIKVE